MRSATIFTKFLIFSFLLKILKIWINKVGFGFAGEAYRHLIRSHNFNDLRGGQKGTGPTQTIIVWGSDKENVLQLLQPIVDITKGLPYS